MLQKNLFKKYFLKLDYYVSFLLIKKMFLLLIDKCQKLFENEGKKVNGKSLLKLLSIGIKNGSEVTVHAEGPDAEQAVEVLGELLATIRD